MNYFHHFYPSLLKLPGFLVEFITPIIKVGSVWLFACRVAGQRGGSLTCSARLRLILCLSLACPWLALLACLPPPLTPAGHQGQGGHQLLHPARVRGVARGARQQPRLDHQVL